MIEFTVFEETLLSESSRASDSEYRIEKRIESAVRYILAKRLGAAWWEGYAAGKDSEVYNDSPVNPYA